MIVKTSWPLVPCSSDITRRCCAPISVLAGTQCWAAAGGGLAQTPSETSDTTPQLGRFLHPAWGPLASDNTAGCILTASIHLTAVQAASAAVFHSMFK